MVKSKKLSRGSLAVLLLALLLGISMVVGITGAWFTYKTSLNPSTTGTPGVIAISLTGGALAEKSGTQTDLANFVPGDKLSVADLELRNVQDSAHEDAYVLYSYQLKVSYKLSGGSEFVEFGNHGLQLKTAAADGENVFIFGDGTAATNAAAWIKLEHGYHYDFGGMDITFNANAGNEIYDQTAKKQYILNAGNEAAVALTAAQTEAGWASVNLVGATLKFELVVTAHAIQVQNITADSTGYAVLNGYRTTWGYVASGEGVVVADLVALPTAPAGVAAN